MAPTACYGCNTRETPTTENRTNLTNSHNTDISNGQGNLRLAGEGRDGAPNAETVFDERTRENGGSATQWEEHVRGAGAGRPDDGRSCRGGTRTRLNLASLNVNGYATTGGDLGGNKWLMMNQLIRDEKICILALQETHLSARRREELEGLFGQYLSILCGDDDQMDARAGGVAFVINKRRMNADACETTLLVPGRALMLKIPWTNGRVLTILNVYAPNASGENADFWKTLRELIPRKPDVMMGDFNVVEDGIDRLPARRDPGRPTSELRTLCREMHLVDGWRTTNPTLREYTYMHGATGSQSRLDRIYGTTRTLRDASVWTIREAGVPTDHKMVAVSLANRAEPFKGGGRWSMPTHLLEDAEMIATMKRIGSEFVEEVDAITERSEARNPQTAYATFKEKLRREARARAKTKIPKVRRRLESMRLDLKATLNPREGSADEASARSHAAILQDRITKLETKYFSMKRRTVEEAHWERDEKISKQWIRKNATPLP
ncbi:Endonuclease/exonuclease/phosphatase, partial [Lenzites betulinus]